MEHKIKITPIINRIYTPKETEMYFGTNYSLKDWYYSFTDFVSDFNNNTLHEGYESGDVNTFGICINDNIYIDSNEFDFMFSENADLQGVTSCITEIYKVKKREVEEELLMHKVTTQYNEFKSNLLLKSKDVIFDSAYKIYFFNEIFNFIANEPYFIDDELEKLAYNFCIEDIYMMYLNTDIYLSDFDSFNTLIDFYIETL